MSDIFERLKTARDAYERWGERALEPDPDACADYINALEDALYQALSEANKRADNARRQALEDAAKAADDIGTWRHKFVSAASAIRAMKSEETP